MKVKPELWRKPTKTHVFGVQLPVSSLETKKMNRRRRMHLQPMLYKIDIRPAQTKSYAPRPRNDLKTALSSRE